MTAQPITPVPTATQAPPVSSPGGHGKSAFTDYLGSTEAAPSTGQRFGNSAAPTSAHPWHKATTKRSRASGDGSSSNGQANSQTAAATQPLAAPANATSDSGASNAAGAETTATGAPSRSTLALGGRRSLLAGSASRRGSGLPLSGPFSGLLGAGSSVSLAANQSTPETLGRKPTTATLLTNRMGIPPGLLGQTQGTPPNGGASAGSPLPPSATTNAPGAGPHGATFASSHFGAPGATATSNLALAAAAARAAAAHAASPSGKSGASTASGANDSPNGKASGIGKTLATVPGAADLNARIVAGANNLSVHPNQAATATAAALMQPKDPNAGAMPPSTSNSILGGKARAPAGIASPSGGGTDAAGNQATSANGATDPRSFAAALDHTPAVSRNASAATVPPDTTQSQSGGSTDNGNPAASNAGLLAAPANVNPTVPGALPVQAGLHPAMLPLPVAEQVAVNIKQALNVGANEIQIQLKPDSLGVIDVKLNVNHDGRLTAVISAHRSDTLNLLKQDASHLQQSLRDAGFTADSGSLSFNLNSNTQSFAQNTPQASSTPSMPSSAMSVPSVSAPSRASRQHLGTVDLHV